MLGNFRVRFEKLDNSYWFTLRPKPVRFFSFPEQRRGICCSYVSHRKWKNIMRIKIKKRGAFLLPLGKTEKSQVHVFWSEIWKSLECSFCKNMWIFVLATMNNSEGERERSLLLLDLGCEKHVCLIMLLYCLVDVFRLFLLTRRKTRAIFMHNMM